MRRRNEDAAARIDLQTEHRRRVEIVVEDERLVLLVMALQVLDEARRPRPLPLQPLHLVGGAVRILKNPVGVAGEICEVARLRVRKAANRDAAHAVGAFGVIVFPGDVVARARRQDIDIVTLREPFRRQAARVFRSAENLCSVSLNDESDPHVVIMCMLAFAVCVSHFPVILGSGPTPWSGGKSPESPATPIASSMSIRCPATRDCCSRPIDAPLKADQRICRILRRPRPVPTPSTSSCSTEISITRPTFRGCSKPCAPCLGRRGRVVVALYNWYFAWLFRLADRLGLRQGPPHHHVHHAGRSRAACAARWIRTSPPAAGRVRAMAFLRTRVVAERRDAGGARTPLAVARHGRCTASDRRRRSRAPFPQHRHSCPQRARKYRGRPSPHAGFRRRHRSDLRRGTLERWHVGRDPAGDVCCGTGGPGCVFARFSRSAKGRPMPCGSVSRRRRVTC